MIVGDKGRIAFAKIKDYYEENANNFSVDYEIKTHMELEQANVGAIKCPYLKRRKIELIKTFDDVKKINPYIYKAMAVNRHSLSCLDEYADTILSSCYNIYIKQDVLSITFNVETEKNIDAMDLVNFISSTTRLITNGDEKPVSVKTTLQSPGEIILQIANWIPDNTTLIAIGIFLCGGKIGNCEMNSLVGVVRDFMNQKHNKKIRELEEQAKILENRGLLADIERKELENKIMERNLVNLDNNAKEFITASQKLKVRNIDKNIIYIESIFPNKNL